MTKVRPRVYGGNRVTRFPQGAKAALRVGEGAYVFWCIPLNAGASYRLEGPTSCTVLCKAESNGTLTLGDGEAMLSDGDSAQIEDRPIMLTAADGRATALVAATETVHVGGPSITITRAGQHYRVSKPWGHELWLSEGHATHCLKELSVRAGNRTSLQYHVLKDETILVSCGRMKLVFKAEDGVENDAVLSAHLGHVVLPPVSAIHVPPGTLHRLEALTDVLMYEASTPHLDDVIRVQDDTARADGRVASEHGG